MIFSKVEVINVVDGDTLDLEIDLGFGIFTRQRIRLARINAPETRTKDLLEKNLGNEAENALVKWLDDVDAKDLHLETTKKGKFGRWVAELWCTSNVGDEYNLSDWMVINDYAIYKDY